MTDRLLKLINERYALKGIDCGEFSKMTVNGMNFSISAYKAEGLGHVSVMRASGFMGLMKMDTLIINPKDIDLPLYSYDRIFAMGNDTLIVELYDTLLGDYSEKPLLSVKSEEKYSAIPERDPGEHWYDSIKLISSISKKGKKKHFSLMNSLTEQHFEIYLASGSTMGVSDAADIQKNIATQNGGGAYLAGGNLTVSGGSFFQNQAQNGAGAYLASGTMEMTGGSISENQAALDRGGAYLAGGSFEIGGGMIEKNTANNGAAALVANGNVVLVIKRKLQSPAEEFSEYFVDFLLEVSPGFCFLFCVERSAVL